MMTMIMLMGVGILFGCTVTLMYITQVGAHRKLRKAERLNKDNE